MENTMTTKKFANEYGEEITVTVKNNEIWVLHGDISNKQFVFTPIVKIAEGTLIPPSNKIKDGTVILSGGQIISVDEYNKILAAARELGYLEHEG
jgi:hypothetical protein